MQSIGRCPEPRSLDIRGYVVGTAKPIRPSIETYFSYTIHRRSSILYDLPEEGEMFSFASRRSDLDINPPCSNGAIRS